MATCYEVEVTPGVLPGYQPRPEGDGWEPFQAQLFADNNFAGYVWWRRVIAPVPASPFTAPPSTQLPLPELPDSFGSGLWTGSPGEDGLYAFVGARVGGKITMTVFEIQQGKIVSGDDATLVATHEPSSYRGLWAQLPPLPKTTRALQDWL